MATPREQIERLIEGLISAGLSVGGNFDPSRRPVTMEISDAAGTRQLKIFCWNIGPGGPGRPPDERRVQATRTGDAPLLVPGDPQTLVLGYHDEHDLFAAWDVEKHPNPSSSASLQIPLGRITLEEAAEAGFAARERELAGAVAEVVVVFRPELIGAYLDLLPAFAVADPVEAVATAAAGRGVELPLEELPGDAERRRTISRVSRAVRDLRFRDRVLRAYGKQCAFCGLGSGLAEAAHIRAVERGGADQILNGLAACPTHHRAFDRGLLLVDDDYTIRINEARLEAAGASMEDKERLARQMRDSMHLPERDDLRPDAENLAAHRALWE